MAETPVTYRDTVYPWQCDHIGPLNVMWYVGKFDEATWNLFTELTVVHMDRAAHRSSPLPPVVAERARALLAS